jgi:subfamily B ATP-binding cassette protein MsbA
MRNPFWQTVGSLFAYKRAMAVALAGAVVSAACFGVGLSMMLPTFSLLLQQKRTVRELVDSYLTPESMPAWLYDALHGAATSLPDDPFWAFVVVMGVIALLTLIGSTGRYIHAVTTLTITERAAMDLRARMFRRFIHAPIAFALQRGSSDLISRTVTDTRILTRGHQEILGKAVAEILKGAAALLVALVLDWMLSLVVLIGAPVIVVLLRKFGKVIRRASKRVLHEQGRILGAMHESLGGLRVVKVHQAEGYERRRFSQLNRNLFSEQMRMRRARALSSPVIETIAILGVMVVASIAAWLIFNRNDEPQRFMTVLFALVAAGASLKPLTQLHTQLKESEAAAARVLEAIDAPIEPTYHGHRRPADRRLPPHHRDIAFEGVSFTYPGAERPAVRDLSLQLTQGQNVAIVGGNGSGKTTVLSMLPRLLEPQVGRVVIDGIDIADVSLRSLRKQMAVVTQQSVLFAGTIADNIAYGRRHTPMDRIVAAATAAFAHDFVTALPGSYLTALGEHGEGLSGGQKQRLCIARAILRDPAILILDEATSQIDSESEAKINQALRAFRRGRTTFTIAHRLSTVVDADLIVVMHDGVILDQGRHAELLDRCEAYRGLVRTQLAGGE